MCKSTFYILLYKVSDLVYFCIDWTTCLYLVNWFFSWFFLNLLLPTNSELCCISCRKMNGHKLLARVLNTNLILYITLFIISLSKGEERTLSDVTATVDRLFSYQIHSVDGSERDISVSLLCFGTLGEPTCSQWTIRTDWNADSFLLLICSTSLLAHSFRVDSELIPKSIITRRKETMASIRNNGVINCWTIQFIS